MQSSAVQSNYIPHRLARLHNTPVLPDGSELIRKTVIPPTARYCAWGCFRCFDLAVYQAAIRDRSHGHITGGSRLHADGHSTQQLLLKKWSEREDLNLRPLVSQTSALTGLRHAPNVVPLARIGAMRKARSHHFGASASSAGRPRGPGTTARLAKCAPTRPSGPDPASPGRRQGRQAPFRGAPGPARWGRRARRACRPCGRW